MAHTQTIYREIAGGPEIFIRDDVYFSEVTNLGSKEINIASQFIIKNYQNFIESS